MAQVQVGDRVECTYCGATGSMRAKYNEDRVWVLWDEENSTHTNSSPYPVDDLKETQVAQVRAGMRVMLVQEYDDEVEYRTIRGVPGNWEAVDDDGRVCGRIGGPNLPHWYEEVKQVDEFETALALAGLNNELAQVRGQIVELERHHESLEMQAATLKRLLPPFEKGQKVRTPSKGVLVVDDVAQAFGGWVVLGHFPGSPSKPYTYPASELEAA